MGQQGLEAMGLRYQEQCDGEVPLPRTYGESLDEDNGGDEIPERALYWQGRMRGSVGRVRLVWMDGDFKGKK